MSLHLRDCLDGMGDLESGSVDMVLCDLPYGMTRNTWDSLVPLAELWGHWLRVCKDNAAIVLFGQGLFSARLMMSAPQLYRYSWVWKKGGRTTGFLNAKRQPLRNHEDILVFYRTPPTYNPQMREGKPLHGRGSMVTCKQTSNYGVYKDVPADTKSTKKYPISVLDFEKPHPAIHPTQKPVDLLRYLIRTYTAPGELILDSTAGSGSTLVAAREEGRNYVAFETDAAAYELALSRLVT